MSFLLDESQWSQAQFTLPGESQLFSAPGRIHLPGPSSPPPAHVLGSGASVASWDSSRGALDKWPSGFLLVGAPLGSSPPSHKDWSQAFSVPPLLFHQVMLRLPEPTCPLGGWSPPSFSEGLH